MRGSIQDVGRFYGGRPLQRPELERPRVDRDRRGIHAAGRTILYGAEEHRVLKDLIAPKRLWRNAEKERYDNFAIRRRVLVDSLRAVAGTPDGPNGALQNAFADAWTAAHFDRVIDDLCDNGHLPSDAQELKLGWNEADPQQRQQLLTDVHWSAPRAYTFAQAVGERADMSAERTLHALNSAPAYETSFVAADLLMSGIEGAPYTLQAEAAELIRTEFDNATDGRRIAELALELIDRQKPAKGMDEAVVETLAELLRDPTADVAPASGAVTAKPEGTTGGQAATSEKPGKSIARE
ncbi:hypothetical protein AB0F43_09320 [Kribbella sp. NPDC023972]|uniref:hypothetical protein n=1 Tax=Kribbella sp. NPDC023972 TaxID=3154795 RepID=UPI0033E8F49B